MGYSYWFARAIGFAVHLVAMRNIMATWVSNEKYGPVWISIFFIAVVIFNFFNVRRYGEIEYWLTVFKIAAIVIIIILGILLPLGVAPGIRQLGTSLNNKAVSCSLDLLKEGRCLDNPGIQCDIATNQLMLIYRLGGGSIPSLFL